jgi:hypothetical protein
MKITGRTHTQHCPVIDSKDVRHCLKPGGRTLLLTAKVLVLHQGDRVKGTDCARGIDEDNCMSVYKTRLTAVLYENAHNIFILLM